MDFDAAFDEGEPETAAAGGVYFAVPAAKEVFEDERDFLWKDADPIVSYRENTLVVRPGSAEGDAQTRHLIRQQSIFNELGKNLPPARLIAVQHSTVFWKAQGDVGPFPLDKTGHGLQGFFDTATNDKRVSSRAGPAHSPAGNRQ